MAKKDQQSFDNVNESLYKQGSTDGLPIVPPSDRRVEEMLTCTDLSPDHELARLGNREGILTVRKLAINGVMAGCNPLHMPILIAGIKALGDPDSNSIQVSVSTGSWAYLWIINGPIRNELDIQSSTGAFGPGYLSNRSVGRALGLAYKNTAKIHPEEKDMSTVGNPFKFSLIAGENEEDSPWKPLHVTEGHSPEDNTITFAGPNSFVQYIPEKFNAKSILKGMIHNTPPYMVGAKGAIATTEAALKKLVFHGLAPENANDLSEAGLSKQDVKEYIFKNSYLSENEFGGRLNKEGVEDILHPQFDSPEYMKIPVIGGPGRKSAIIGPTRGGPVTKKIGLPDNWENLLEQYKPRLERDWPETKE